MSILRLFGHSVITLLLLPFYNLNVFLDIDVWDLLCKQLENDPDHKIRYETKFGPTSRTVMPKLYISPLADTAACSSNISGAHHLQPSDSPLVWVIKLPSSCNDKSYGNIYDYKLILYTLASAKSVIRGWLLSPMSIFLLRRH